MKSRANVYEELREYENRKDDVSGNVSSRTSLLKSEITILQLDLKIRSKSHALITSALQFLHVTLYLIYSALVCGYHKYMKKLSMNLVHCL